VSTPFSETLFSAIEESYAATLKAARAHAADLHKENSDLHEALDRLVLTCTGYSASGMHLPINHPALTKARDLLDWIKQERADT
jgi:hypothetical protein